MRPVKYRIIDEKYKFYTYFDRDTGTYMRSGIMDKEGRETDSDPFMASFPHLLDIGVMGHCEHGLSGMCERAGIQCYQSGGTKVRDNMSLSDFKWITNQCENKVQQFALGGRGDPDMHENFEELLAYSRQKGIVPNITTSGYQLDCNKAKIIKKYCGAAAVSWYRNEYTTKAIELLISAGVKTNIHFVLGNDSIDEAIDIIFKGILPKGIGRIIFLLFKPVGKGNMDNLLKPSDERVRKLFELFDEPGKLPIIGFDSCCVPGVISFCKNIDPKSYDCCEGGRFSAYISSDLRMMPCSFDQNERFGVNLRGSTIAEVWESPEFIKFRDILNHACPDCGRREICMGGCPVVPEINLCPEKERG